MCACSVTGTEHGDREGEEDIMGRSYILLQQCSFRQWERERSNAKGWKLCVSLASKWLQSTQLIQGCRTNTFFPSYVTAAPPHCHHILARLQILSSTCKSSALLMLVSNPRGYAGSACLCSFPGARYFCLAH